MPPRKRTSAQEPPATPELAISREEATEKILARIKLGLELQNRPINGGEEVEDRIKEIEKWNSYNKELLVRIFTTSKLRDEYTISGPSSMKVSFGRPSAREKLQGSIEHLKYKIQSLESIFERLELIPLAPGVQVSQPQARREERELGNIVFVVHGHDEEAKQTTARFLEKLGLEAIILHEQASGGRTVMEKLEFYADVDFAVVLLTPDDIGAIKTSPQSLQPRARQNVILELGFFFGKLGRDHVCALHRGNLELPSDFLGVVFIPMDTHGAWKYNLGKELKAAGFPVDLNKI